MDILYHYCSNITFLSIIENRSIWLSALSLSNDSLEGKLVSKIFTQIANADNLDQTYTLRLQESLSVLNQFFDGLGFCLSEDGDLLSQWRGYAADATGISIGFSKDYLESLAKASKVPNSSDLVLQRVEYDQEAQEILLQPTYMAIKKFIDVGTFRYTGVKSLLDIRTDEEVELENKKNSSAFFSLSMTTLTLLPKIFLLKTAAFREEREWRLISNLFKTGDDECSFRAIGNRIIPYKEYELVDLDIGPIVQVILGPKNTTPNYVIESLLKQRGFDSVTVIRSEASYR